MSATVPVALSRFFDLGMPYTDYRTGHEAKIAREKKLPAEQQDHYLHYIELNLHRTERLDKTFTCSPELLETMAGLRQPLHWLVLSEYWCGDAAQNVPALAAMAEASGGRISMRIVYRDQHPELMDAFLTNSSRSIPKLIVTDESGTLLGTWGPRPAAAQQLVLELKANPETAPTYAEQLHLWYARNRCADLQQEIVSLLNAL